MGVQFFVPVNTQTLAVSVESTLANTHVTALGASSLITASNGVLVSSGGLEVVGVPGVSGETILGGDLAVHGEIVFDCSASFFSN